jgi:ABC-type multidrug transport system fused ATPase/permease subunit
MFKITSVERINGYIGLERENMNVGLLRPSDTWPEKGRIEFKNVSFAYDEHLPSVLKNVSFTIDPKEKVGIVGRTGSGKSTIFQALIRVCEPNGHIIVDGLNIKDLNLNDLRGRISIIPVSMISDFRHRFNIGFYDQLSLNCSKSRLFLVDLCDSTWIHSASMRMIACGKPWN